MIKAVIFDWNGVIVNDLENVYEATMHVVKYYGGKRISLEKFRDEYILPWPEFYKKINIKIDEKQKNVFLPFFKSLQLKPLYPDVINTLQWLKNKNIRLDVLSSHPKEFIEREIKLFGLEKFFDKIYCEVVNKMNKIHEVVENLDHIPEHVLYVGDMVHDIETAKHGGVKSAAFVNGYNSRKTLLKSNPDFVLEKLSDLKSLPIFSDAEATGGAVAFKERDLE